MSDIVKGDWVVVTESGYGYSRGISFSYDKGEELEVTSVSTNLVRGRQREYGPVIWIPRERVRKAKRRIGVVPEGGISQNDPRVAWIFEDAARMAERLNLCGDFDRLCDALNLPGRMRTFTIKVASAEGIQVSAKVRARSRSLAKEQLLSQFQTTPTKAIAS